MVDNWFSVKDKLPQHKETVLVMSNPDCFVVCVFLKSKEVKEELIEKGIVFDTDDPRLYNFASQEVRGHVLNDVTHWCYIIGPNGRQ